MRDYIKAVQTLLEADAKKTKTKDQTIDFDVEMDDGSSKGDLAKPINPKADVPPKMDRRALPGQAAGAAKTRASVTGGENKEQSLRYLDHLMSRNMRDEVSDEDAARIAGAENPEYLEGPETPLLIGDELPVTPDNLPQVMNTALIEKGDSEVGTVRPPEWHMVKHLPGYLQQGIRAMGRMVFAPFTDTPIEDIQVMATLLNARDVQVMADFIRRNGMKDDEATMEAHDIIPGYGADIQVWNTEGYTFMLVKDHAGAYIYGWPGGRGIDLDGPESYRQLESEEVEGDLVEEDFNWEKAASDAMAAQAEEGETENTELPKGGNKPQGTFGTVQDQQRKAIPMGDNPMAGNVKEAAEFLAGVDKTVLSEGAADDGTANYFAQLAGVRPVAKAAKNLDSEVLDLAILAGIRR